jgi:hypothetical protein
MLVAVRNDLGEDDAHVDQCVFGNSRLQRIEQPPGLGGRFRSVGDFLADLQRAFLLIDGRPSTYLCLRIDDFHSWNPSRNRDIQTAPQCLGAIQDQDGRALGTCLLPERDQHPNAVAINEGELLCVQGKFPILRELLRQPRLDGPGVGDIQFPDEPKCAGDARRDNL